MSRKTRWILRILLLFVIAFGIATQHYEVDPDHQHRRWAEERGLPPPSKILFFTGTALTVVGSIALGVLLSKRPLSRHS